MQSTLGATPDIKPKAEGSDALFPSAGTCFRTSTFHSERLTPDWLYNKNIHRQEYNFSREEGDYFAELYRRESHLAGVCKQCNERPITRMGLTHLVRMNTLSQIGFYCDECGYRGGTPTGYYHPSFFIDAYNAPRCEQLMVTDKIKDHYIDRCENLTQKKMERFFATDANFVDAEAGFFEKRLAA